MPMVRDLMTKEVFTLDHNASVLEAAYALTRRQLGGAPVKDADGNLIGMLSKTDIVDPNPSDWIQGEATVEDIMNPNVLGLYADDPAAAAAKGMADNHIHRAVVYGPGGELVGIITSMDLVRAIAEGADFSGRDL